LEAFDAGLDRVDDVFDREPARARAPQEILTGDRCLAHAPVLHWGVGHAQAV